MAPATASPRKVFENAGGFAPTIGIIGTVMGLVHVLENLANPATLGPAISGAFIATLYGVAIGERHLPARSATASKDLSKAEAELRMLTLEGILSIQAGDNPRIVAEKLQSVPRARRARREARAPSARGPARGRRRAEAGGGGGLMSARGGRRGRRGGHGTTASTRTTSAGCSRTRT